MVEISTRLDRRLLLGGAIATMLLASCRQSQTKGKKVQLFLNWIFSGSFAGEAVAADHVARSSGIELILRQGGQGLDPLRLVGDGDFGTAAFDEIIRANEKGADFVIIGAINEQTPAAFVSLKGSNIKSPRDFPGKRIGVLPFGSTGLVYKALIKKLSIDENSITEVIVSPDLRPFISGSTHDVQPIFVYDETVTLDSQKIEYNLIKPEDFDLKFAGPCYFTTRKTVVENRELCIKMANILKASWNEVKKDPNMAISNLKTLDKAIDANRELAVLNRGMRFFVSGSRAPLTFSEKVFDTTIAQLLDLQVLKKAPHRSVVAFDIANLTIG